MGAAPQENGFGAHLDEPGDVCSTDDLDMGCASLHSAADAEEERIPLHIEVCQATSSDAPPTEVEQAVRRCLGQQSLCYVDGPITLPQGRDAFLDTHVQSVSVCDAAADRAAPLGQRLLFWQARITCVYGALVELVARTVGACNAYQQPPINQDVTCSLAFNLFAVILLHTVQGVLDP